MVISLFADQRSFLIRTAAIFKGGLTWPFLMTIIIAAKNPIRNRINTAISFLKLYPSLYWEGYFVNPG